MGEFRKNDRSSSGGSRRLVLGPKPDGGPQHHLGVKIPLLVSPTAMSYRYQLENENARHHWQKTNVGKHSKFPPNGNNAEISHVAEFPHVSRREAYDVITPRDVAAPFPRAN